MVWHRASLGSQLPRAPIQRKGNRDAGAGGAQRSARVGDRRGRDGGDGLDVGTRGDSLGGKENTNHYFLLTSDNGG